MSVSFGDPVRRMKNGTPSKFYWVRTYDDETKRRSWESTRCTTIQAAKQWRKTREVDEALGKDRRKVRERGERLFSEAFTEWLESQEERVSPARYQLVKGRGDGFWVPYFGNRRLQDIESKDIEAYLRRRRAGTVPRAKLPDRKKGGRTSHRKRTVGHVTLNDDLRGLRQFLAFCRRKGWLLADPAEGIEAFPGEDRAGKRYLTDEEEAALLRACRESDIVEVEAVRNAGGPRGGKTTRDKRTFTQTIPVPEYLETLVLVAMRTGFRRRTLLELEWGWIDLKAARWRIPKAAIKTKEPFRGPISESVVEALKAHRARVLDQCVRDKVRPVERLGASARVFRVQSSSSVTRSFKRAARRAGIPELRFHDLRRHFINRARRRGVGIEATMRLSLHKSIAVVMKAYRDVGEDELAEAVKALDGAPSPKAEPKGGGA